MELNKREAPRFVSVSFQSFNYGDKFLLKQNISFFNVNIKVENYGFFVFRND